MVAERFQRFFAAANEGRTPYPWQVRLVEKVATTGRWPGAITAPTGSGKSSVVDVHVFLAAERALTRAADTTTAIERPPRRLVLVSPRRVLVDDQFERALTLAELIALADDGSVLAEVRDALEALITANDIEGSPLRVTRLRGGIPLDTAWRMDPGACQIICATPDMWGSRLLFRGYRASRRSRNLETGLLASDATVIVDEAHLRERLIDTSTRLGAMAPGCPSFQLVAMSATRASADGHGLEPADLDDPSLARRVTAAKKVRIEEVDVWDTDGPRRVAEVARTAHEADPENGTVGVFVNTVERGLSVARQLAEPGDTSVRFVCGRMRPIDLERLRSDNPGLLTPAGNTDVDFLVATQSLEVGVDLDLGTIVSEIAPASALAQRLGRLNRTGSRASADFIVVAPAEPEGPDDAAFGPYSVGQVHASRSWLEAVGPDASPKRVSETDLPEHDTIPVPAITGAELRTISMTSHELAADIEPAFYLDDPCEREPREVQICAREHLDMGEQVVRAFLAAVPPMTHELVSLSLPDGKPSGRTVIEKILAVCPDAWVVRFEQGEFQAEPVTGTEEPTVQSLRGGDIVVIAAGTKVMEGGVIGSPMPKAAAIDDVSGAPVADRLTPPPVTLRVTPETAAQIADLAAEDPILGSRRARAAVADAVDGSDPALATRLRRHRFLSDLSVVFGWSGGPDAPGLLVVTEVARGGGDVDRSVPEVLVTVNGHCAAVAERMAHIAESLDGLVDVERVSLEQAALSHDDGKRHPRFQQRMGAQDGDEALAKPRPGHVPDRGDGWRHEQLSAAMTWARTGDPLATMLVAAHHGTGRPLFDRGAADLVGGWDEDEAAVRAAVELFGPAGTYEELRAQVESEIGAHRLAYLEALVRCADAQVSREGGQ